MFDFLRSSFPLMVLMLWVGGLMTVAFRARATQHAYLRRFPPIARVRLDQYLARWGSDGWKSNSPQARTIDWLWSSRQDDPELEQLRHEMRRRWRLLYFWMFGPPLLTVGVAVLWA